MNKPTKPLTAKEKTVSMFRGTTYGEEQTNRAPRIVDSGPPVSRIALNSDAGPAFHFRHPGSQETLCGARVTYTGEEKDTAGLGICQVCRAESSRLRAVVGR